MEKAMATHSSTLAWKIPWMEEPGGLQSMGSLSQTWLSNFTFTFHFHALEKEMATHSSVLAWRIPGMAEPDRLPSMGSHRVGHDWHDLAAAAEASYEKITQVQAAGGKAGWLADKTHVNLQVLEGQSKGGHSSLFLSVPPVVLSSVPHTYKPIHISWNIEPLTLWKWGCSYKEHVPGISLVVQWIQVCLPM